MEILIKSALAALGFLPQLGLLSNFSERNSFSNIKKHGFS